MLLATTTVEDFDRFNDVFSTRGAEKRRQHGSKEKFASDPEVPPILQEAGHKSRPQVAELGGRYEA